jgi:YesN/AraC family two-component response regulator
VLVSGYTGPMLAERALAAGVTEILKKPVQSRDIASALARILKRGQDPFTEKGVRTLFPEAAHSSSEKGS